MKAWLPNHHSPAARQLQVVEVYSLALWLAVAVAAVVRPSLLPLPMWGLLGGPRADAVGILAFGVFCVASLGRRWASSAAAGSTAVGPSTTTRERALLSTARDAAALVVVYLTANWVSHPETAPLPLTHVLPWPSESQTSVAAFAVSLGAAAVLAASVTEPAPVRGRRS